MGLIWINEVSVSFGGPLLLDGATLQIEAGEKIGLLGRNGSGKSTLMKLLMGDVSPDSGAIIRKGEARIAMLPQDVPDDLPGTVYDVVASGGREHLELLREYHELTVLLSNGGEENLLKKLELLQRRLEASGAWRYHQQVEAVLSRTELDENAEFGLLSAGMKRRVLLARALVNEPDILLLDEPTNHLDIEAVLWLEDFLRNFDRTLLLVTHDRAFLQRVATRIVEIDRGRLLSFACNYSEYLERRQALLEAQQNQAQEFDKKLAREEIWIRQGIKARRTRNEGRVRALMQLRRERAQRQEQTGNVRLAIQDANRSGRLVVEAQDIHFSFGDNKIVEGFSTTIIRGDKVGIIGPNGSGKTTLLKILLGELNPDAGSVRQGAGVQVAYFDQLRAQLDENKTLKDNVAAGSDMVIVGGASRHIISYLQDFLFPPDRIMSPVSSLSGGERNRLLLAKLFLLPSNVLVLDEPTNDLDMETLELLEERLLDYGGTIILVSHDRAFLNNVATSTIVFAGKGRLQEYVGGYDDWIRQKTKQVEPLATLKDEQKQKKDRAPREKKKLSYKEKQELEGLPVRIEALEKDKQRLHETLNSPEFYVNRDAEKIGRASAELSVLEKELEGAYGRWEELESLAEKLSGEQI
ncbi:MAG: ATP-binding cassette domain-containing protein [Syntrophales bacterium]|jgi:ATP-binding cassette subfamily F protein uup|nr:ATP-binding cassette domain-containing protein [Syntrophales bacterium]